MGRTQKLDQEITPRGRAARVDQGAPVNEVRLVGTVTGAPTVRTLPSGDDMVVVRISVPRAAPARGRSTTRPGVDSVPCTVWLPRVRRGVMSWRAGDVVELSGSVRCRFFQAGGTTQSRVEVEVTSARIIRRPRAS